MLDEYDEGFFLVISVQSLIFFINLVVCLGICEVGIDKVSWRCVGFGVGERVIVCGDSYYYGRQSWKCICC